MTIEATGEQMGLVISVKDRVSAAFVPDVEGAGRDLRYGEFSQSMYEMPQSVAMLLLRTSHPQVVVILL